MSGWINRLVSELGYVGLALLTLLENVFPPLPSEVILPLGGFLAARGQLTLTGVVAAGTAGSVLGALLLYAVGRLLGRERILNWTERYGHWLLLTRDDVEDAFDWFDRHGAKAVFLARLVPGARSLISIPAGVAGMKLVPFILYTTLGAALWSAALSYAGMLLGDRYHALETVLNWVTYAIIALFLLSIARWYLKRKRQP